MSTSKVNPPISKSLDTHETSVGESSSSDIIMSTSKVNPPISKSLDAQETSVGKSSSLDTSGSRHLNSQDFLHFLASQVDIAELTVVTKSGDKISASFDETGAATTSDSKPFKSLEYLNKTLASQDSISSNDISKSTAYHKDAKTAPSILKEPIVSVTKDWNEDYGKTHKDVDYRKSFQTNEQSEPQSSNTVKPTEKGGKADWQGMFDSALSPLVEAASLVSPLMKAQHLSPMLKAQQGVPKRTLVPKRQGRKPRKVIPIHKEYIAQYSDSDVLFGRGGRSNHHPGNKIYRDIVTERQPHYRTCDKNQKTRVAQSIVDYIQKAGGRFLELDREVVRWYVVPNIVARRKVGQALRENNTEEARAAKREKYGNSKAKKLMDNTLTYIKQE